MQSNELIEINEIILKDQTSVETQIIEETSELTMQDNLMIGFKIMGIGIGIVFLVLAILYAIIKIMGKMAKQ